MPRGNHPHGRLSRLTNVLERNPTLARAGNGVVPLQAATALGLLYEDLRATT